MEIIKEIKQICVESDNEWFLKHSFTKIALYDLELLEELKKENISTFNEIECVCHTTYNSEEGCRRCDIEMIRSEEFDKLNLKKSSNYDYNTYYWINSKWIIADKINDEIPGFILIKCCGDDVDSSPGFTHALEFACVRSKYRKKGILKNMINQIPKEWNIWLEANSKEIKNVENIWEKCGFQYHMTIMTINDCHLIYKRLAF